MTGPEAGGMAARVLTARGACARLLVAVLAATVASCAAPPPALVDDLPPQLAVRSDLAYVGGRVIGQEPIADGGVRIHVRGTLALAAREAIVTVPAGTLVLWRGGRTARPAELAVGRTVVVWTRDHDPEGSPPAVLADAVLVDRR
jgi:hypothetical protein